MNFLEDIVAKSANMNINLYTEIRLLKYYILS